MDVYEQKLGIKFTREQGIYLFLLPTGRQLTPQVREGLLKCVFRYIDPLNHDKEFHFTISQKDGSFYGKYTG